MPEKAVARPIVRLTLLGNPQPKARARVTRNGGTYTPAATGEAEHAIRLALLCKTRATLDAEGRFAVRVEFYRSDRRRCDLDNLAKLVLDACTGIVWADDAQVAELHATVARGCAEARTELSIARLDDPGSQADTVDFDGSVSGGRA